MDTPRQRCPDALRERTTGHLCLFGAFFNHFPHIASIGHVDHGVVTPMEHPKRLILSP